MLPKNCVNFILYLLLLLNTWIESFLIFVKAGWIYMNKILTDFFGCLGNSKILVFFYLFYYGIWWSWMKVSWNIAYGCNEFPLKFKKNCTSAEYDTTRLLLMWYVIKKGIYILIIFIIWALITMYVLPLSKNKKDLINCRNYNTLRPLWII